MLLYKASIAKYVRFAFPFWKLALVVLATTFRTLVVVSLFTLYHSVAHEAVILLDLPRYILVRFQHVLETGYFLCLHMRDRLFGLRMERSH